jgi:competence protein ComEC
LPKESVYKQNQYSYSSKLDAYYELSDQYTVQLPSHELVGNPIVSGGVSNSVFASHTCGTSNINNHSGVTVFEYHGATVIIPGDNEPVSWKELLKQPNFVSVMNKANIFMASHHGRASGYCSDIFQKKPNLCIVSDGKVLDTDARDRYTYHATGLKVNTHDIFKADDRYCLTTRKDGFVDINLHRNLYGQTNLLVKTMN